ncbi:type II CAAX endopeptidase family protein, partial [Roseisolibacter sp. H3M3-2]|uniref:CPBP family intramembrane glutamic endopeptidase n=1 Tax=Roseisolibacter sp. H3M3-2 TaxID=3031323 RepID=UPI0023DAEAFB
MTAPPAGETLLDRVVLPGGDGRGRGSGWTWPKRIVALVFWGTIQGVFLLPRAVPVPGQPWPGFLLPPAVGLLLNLAIAAAFVWWFALRRGVRDDPRRRATYRLRAVPPAAAPWILPASASMIAVVCAALVVLPRFVRIPPDRNTFLDEYLDLPLGVAAVLVMVAVIAPLLEEFLFRGWMQRTLERRTSPVVAIAVTALAFGLVHVDLFGLPLRVAFGLASGYLAWGTRSIWPSVILHGAYNGSLVVLGDALPQIDERQLTAWAQNDAVFYPALAGLALASLALAASVRRARDAAPAARAARR